MAQMADGVQAGDVLAGKYRVERVLGAGAMGVVVQAHHLGLEKKVAIKFLLPDMAGNEEAVARFAREARAASRITNEHVTHVLDVGTLETGAPYMVMEFLDGTDLHKWVRERGPLSVEEAVDFVVQACEAIAEAHEMGIVHRDLKPANLFCVRRGDGRPFIKVLDFGISKMTAVGGSGSSMSMTRTASLMGTPLYMAPEQMASSRDVDARADIWSLGVILFELLVGRVPFHGDALPEVCLKVTTEPTPPVRTLRPDVPEALEAAIFKCMEKDRNRRFGTVAEFHAAIAFLAPARSTVFAGRAPSARSDETMASSEPGLEPSWRPRSLSAESLGAVGGTKVSTVRRHAGPLATLGGLVTLALIGIAVAVATRSPAKEPPAAAAAGATSFAAAVVAAPPIQPAPPPAAPPPAVKATGELAPVPAEVLATGHAAASAPPIDPVRPVPRTPDPRSRQHAVAAPAQAAAPGESPHRVASPAQAAPSVDTSQAVEVDHGF
jgi:serine/threonine protein kinase